MKKCDCYLCEKAYKYLWDDIGENEWLKRFEEKVKSGNKPKHTGHGILRTREEVIKAEQALTDELRKVGYETTEQEGSREVRRNHVEEAT